MRVRLASAFLVTALLTLSCGTAPTPSPPTESPPPTPPPIVEPDTTAPTVPTGFTVTAIGTTTAAFSWSASTDDVGVTEYRVFRNGAKVATVTMTSYQATSLAASTAYTFTVQACDAAGNCSAQGHVIVTTVALASTPITAPTFSAIDVSAGGQGSHSCAVIVDGTIRCWGQNNSGQLGNGTVIDSSVPVLVSGIMTASTVVTGLSSYTCALLTNGSVRCWGRNGVGQLGNGTTTDSALPVAVTGLVSATQITAGDVQVCARIINGTVQCWGMVGSNVTFPSPPAFLMPVERLGPSSVNPGSVTAVSNGMDYTCAILSSGGISCWGNHTDGRFGQGSTLGEQYGLVLGITTASQISVGTHYACARLADGTIKCWGSAYGTLGDGGTVQSASPVTVSGITTATAVTTASGHSCVLLADGTVKCWGKNGSGQLGTGNYDGVICLSGGGLVPGPCVLTPTTAPGFSAVTKMDAGGAHTCALQTGGTVRCWGANQHGQLGLGTLTSMTTPALVSGF